MLWTIVVPFLFCWVILFVVCYAAVEFGQNYLYDEAVAGAAWRVALGSAILGGLVVWSKTSYDRMFTEQIGSTIVLAIAGFLIFTFLYQFHPLHGVAIGVGSVLLFAGMATIGVESLLSREKPASDTIRHPPVPLRRSTSTTPIPDPVPAQKGKNPSK